MLLHARDLEHEVDVMLRVLLIDDALPPDGLESFEREVAIATTLKHPTIISVGEMQRRDQLVFCVEGGRAVPSLESKFREGHPFSVEEARLIVSDVALALDHAHERNVVHGALVPALIFLRGHGGARVGGFGEGGPTRPSRRSEAAAYMAPEQWHFEGKADARSDVYALGVIAFELMAGRRRTISSGTHGIMTIDPLALTSSRPLRPGLGLNVNAAILRATSKRRSRRFAAAHEFFSMLEATPQTASRASAPTASPQSLVAPPARFSLPLGAIVAVIGTLLGILIVPLARRLHATRISYSALTQGFDVHSIPDPGLTLAHVSPTEAEAPASSSASDLPLSSDDATTTSASANGAVGAQSDSSGFGVIDVEFDGGSATVFIDGVPRGDTPFFYRAPVGLHKVTLAGIPASDPSDRNVGVRGGDTVIAAFKVPR
ncbi:MAG: protein kinase [Gemmatimonadota bacterium]|nr:protein kinase [Gemmatimonadota bacterium]